MLRIVNSRFLLSLNQVIAFHPTAAFGIRSDDDLVLPFTHKSPFSELLTGQMQGALSQEGPPPPFN